MQQISAEQMLKMFKKHARIAGSQLQVEKKKTYQAMAAELERLMQENAELRAENARAARFAASKINLGVKK